MTAWLLWTIAALLSWGVWAVLSKALGDALSPEHSQALSTLGLLPILIPLAMKSRNSLRNSSRRGLSYAFAGGAITCLGNIAYYAALARGEKAATVVSITAIAPLVTVLLALVLLRERINGIQSLGLALSFVAIWLFNVQDQDGVVSRLLIYAVPPIICWGTSGFLQKVATNHLSGEAAALVYLSAFIPVGLVLASIGPWNNPISLQAWLIVCALGFFLGLGNFAVLEAFARGGKAAVIAPLSNLYPVISIPVAVFWFHEKISGREAVAILVALIAVTALSWERTAAATPTIQPGSKTDAHIYQ